MKREKRFLLPEIQYAQMALVAGLLLCLVFGMSFAIGNFFTGTNLTTMVRNFMETALLALPMTFIILTNSIDLSVGGSVAMCAILLIRFYEATGNLPCSVILTMAIGTIGGVLNGFLVGVQGIPGFIATLSTMFLYEGIALGISEAETLTGLPGSFSFLGNGTILHIPVQLLIFIAAAIVFAFVLNRTSFGRYIRIVGFNPECASFSGISTAKIHLINYTVSGFMASLASLIFVSRISAAKSNAGLGYETDAIIAVVLGGTAISGGYGTIEGTVIGAFLVGVLRNGLTLARVPSEVTTIILGSLLLVSIIFSSNAKNWAERLKHKK